MLTLKQQLLSLLMLDIRYFGLDAQGKNIPQIILTNEIKDLFQEYPIGGVILFKENIENKQQLKALTQELQNIYISKKQPTLDSQMLIAVDEEGGVVSRIGFETIGNMALGALNDTQVTQSNGKLIGQKLSELGINFNFAPVVDINSNPNNPIIGVRSFGDKPEHVTKHAKAFIEGLHDSNIISCIKHFPGHGDTATDTHHGTTILNKSLNEIDACELYPYKKLIADNVVDAVMTAHIVIPAIDNSGKEILEDSVAVPATISYEIITNILRKKLAFNGIVVTDALDMHAISQNFDAVTATVRSIKAGCDIILMPVRIWDKAGIENFKEYFNQVYERGLADQELQNRIIESYNRIIGLKKKLSNGGMDSSLRWNDKDNYYNNKDKLLNVNVLCHQRIGEDPSRDAKELENNYNTQYELAQKAITLYKNSANHIPFDFNNKSNVLIIANNSSLLEQAYCIATNIISSRINVDVKINMDKLFLDYQNIDIKHLTQNISEYSQVIVLTNNLQSVDSSRSLSSTPIEDQNNKESWNDKVDMLFSLLNTKQIPYVMLSCRNPYDINFVPNCTTNILVYGVTGFDQTNYIITPFILNLKAALAKILTMDASEAYNKFSPVLI